MLGRTITGPNGTALAPERMPVAPGAPPKRRRIPVVAPVLIIVIAALAAGVLLFLRSNRQTTYTTTPLVRGDLVQSVTASGTVNPQNTVSVGTQVSGTIQSIYVDFNSRVHRGEVLARLDPTQFEAQLSQARGSLAQAIAQAQASRQSVRGANYSVNAANAAIVSAVASVAKSQGALALAQQTIARDRALLSKGFIAQSQYDTDYSNLIAAGSALSSAQAIVAQNTAQSSQTAAGALGTVSTAQAAQAAVQAANAVVAQDAFNFERTIITSPVDGTVVARNVSVGQTVAASFQTPTLFTIAQDLKKMEVDIAVGEPDIGNVRPGDAVSFSVLAYPNQIFQGNVSQVRVNPSTIQNVVTYTVIVLVDNKNNALLPGMTANTSISVASVKHALIVPTQALTYRPAQGTKPRRVQPSGAGTPWGATAGGTAGAIVGGTKGVIFLRKDQKLHALPVRVDLVSGTQAAITPLRGTLSEGDAVVISDSSSAARTQRAATTNPAPGFGRMIR